MQSITKTKSFTIAIHNQLYQTSAETKLQLFEYFTQSICFVTVNNCCKEVSGISIIVGSGQSATMYKYVLIACRIRNSITVRTCDEINGPALPSPQ